MHTRNLLIGLLVILAVTLLLPRTAMAGPEVSFVLGAMIGDSLRDVLQVRPATLTEGFENAPIFGGRLGWSAFPFAIEGSLLYSPSAIQVADVGSFDARIVYAEAELQILILPGPVAPFVSGGIGIHSIQPRIGSEPRENMVGYVLGGGLKIAIGSLGVRADLRDHITPLDVSKLSDDFLQIIGIAENTTLHNVELSGGLTIRF
ncbi:MAG TPA: hypothetical protein VGD06_12470 [Acidobacteriota bacterium]|jgi:hypothetical protein